jgi:hypothetical protein
MVGSRGESPMVHGRSLGSPQLLETETERGSDTRNVVPSSWLERASTRLCASHNTYTRCRTTTMPRCTSTHASKSLDLLSRVP